MIEKVSLIGRSSYRSSLPLGKLTSAENTAVGIVVCLHLNYVCFQFKVRNKFSVVLDLKRIRRFSTNYGSVLSPVFKYSFVSGLCDQIDRCADFIATAAGNRACLIIARNCFHSTLFNLCEVSNKCDII